MPLTSSAPGSCEITIYHISVKLSFSSLRVCMYIDVHVHMRLQSVEIIFYTVSTNSTEPDTSITQWEFHIVSQDGKRNREKRKISEKQTARDIPVKTCKPTLSIYVRSVDLRAHTFVAIPWTYRSSPHWWSGPLCLQESNRQVSSRSVSFDILLAYPLARNHSLTKSSR